MAALGTDKELSDLLDFSAVRNAHFPMPIVNVNVENSFMKEINGFTQRPLLTLMCWSPQNLHALTFFQIIYLFAPNLGVSVE